MATVTGTTANAYANALEWECYSYDKSTLIIKNTDGSNALKLKVLVLASTGGIQQLLELSSGITERTLAAGETQTVKLSYPYYSVYVAVKSSAGGSHATYQVDYIGGLQR